MNNFNFNKNLNSVLLDPDLFKFFNPVKLIIPFFKEDSFSYNFVLNKLDENETNFLLDKDFFGEKVLLIKNYSLFQNQDFFLADTPTRVILDFILTQSIINNATDIHFDLLTSETCVVKFKINTILQKKYTLTREQFESLFLCLKVMNKLDGLKNQIPQSASFLKYFKNNVVDFRFSTHPTVFSERCVIRVLQKKNVLTLDKLKLSDDISKIVNIVINEKHGFVIISGPTNSGKTTFVHSILKEISKQNVSIMTLEDPVEYKLENIIQSNVNENFSFFDGLKSILRQDPDVIFIGEIRDQETANLAVQAALTGHKVIATIHSYSIKAVVFRLLDFKISFQSLSECLLAIFSQRLFRTYKNAEYSDLNLLIDGVLIDKVFKNSFNFNQIPDLTNSLMKRASVLVDQKITTREEIQRVLGNTTES